MLSNVEIIQEVNSGQLVISPFDEHFLEPASYDLRVGKDAATIPSNGDDPRIDLEREGFVVIAPYAPAIVYIMEHLKLPLTLAGRFGLKSSLSRRGIYASVGPQVDPGFEGKLSVTLYNFTPIPLALNYGDTFLSLELHRLNIAASRPYSGDYQNRETFDAREIEPVLGFKGQGLSQVVGSFTEIRQSLAALRDLPQQFKEFLQHYEKENREDREFNRALLTEMKKLVAHIAGERPRTVVLRAIPRRQAREEILALFSESKRSLFYSDVAEQLNLDLEMVVELCNELEKEGRIGVLTRHEAKKPETEGD